MMTNDINILRWNTIHSILFSVLFVLYTIFTVRAPVIVAGAISFFVYWLIHFDRLKSYQPFAGYANYITLIRLILVLCSGIWYKHLPDFTLFIIGLSIFALDGLDGFMARRFKQESKFGAYFDMETDAFYVCIFTIILFEKGLVDSWIIIPGFMRYLFGVTILAIGKKSDEEIKSKIGPLIAGLFFSAVLSPFVLPQKYYFPILVFASALLLFSFMYSFFRMFKIRNHV